MPLLPPGVQARLDRANAGVLVRAGLATLALLAVKLAVEAWGLEVLLRLDLLGALMGGVVFTLAILLAGVLTDFKESERILGELASHVRRMHWDLAVVLQGEALRRGRHHLLEATRSVRASLGDGTAVRLRSIYPSLDELDRLVAEAAGRGAAAANVRTVQVDLASITRVLDRLETIVETRFIRPGYLFAGAVVVLAVAGLTLTPMEPRGFGLFLYAFAVFLLTGLYWLIAALDNPFEGDVRISTRQLAKLEAWLAAQAPAAEAEVAQVPR